MEKQVASRWKAQWKANGQPTEGHVEVDGTAVGKRMEKQVDSRWKTLWKIDGMPVEKQLALWKANGKAHG